MDRSTWLGHGLEEEITQADQDGWSDESVEEQSYVEEEVCPGCEVLLLQPQAL